MGKKGAMKRTKKVAAGSSGGMSMADIKSELSDLFKTLPPNKRAELTTVVEKLAAVTSNFSSEPTTPAKHWQEFTVISELVERIREIESGHSMVRTLPERKSAAKSFLTWLKELGAVINKVEIADFGEQGLGLKVTDSVSEGEEVIRIPGKAIMSVETARASSIGSLIERDPLLTSMPNVVLAVHLLIERNSPASMWENYINVLPHYYNTVLYYTPKQMEDLKGSPALEDALKQYKFVARQYAYFYKLFANTLLKDYLTYDEYRWAVSTVMTRQNLVPAKDQESEEKFMNALIPFWDMANHDQGQVSTDFDPDNNVSLCYAQRAFSAGEQFTIFYGVRANCDLLIHNGFVFMDNQEDCLTLRLGVAKTDSLATLRLALLEKIGIVSGKFYIRRTAEPIDGKLIAFLRVLQMDETQINMWTEAEDPTALLDIKSSLDVDGAVMQYMITRAALLLRAYPTTIEQDQFLIKEKKNEIDRMNCQLRLCEKRILLNCVAYCEQQLKAIKQ